jgi:hypothetical protein
MNTYFKNVIWRKTKYDLERGEFEMGIHRPALSGTPCLICHTDKA